MEDLSLKEQGKQTKEHVEAFMKNQVHLIKYLLAENLAKFGTFIFISFLLAVMGLFFLALLSIAFGLFLSKVLGSGSLAFLIVSVLYLFIGLLIYLARKSLIRNPLLRSILNEIQKI